MDDTQVYPSIPGPLSDAVDILFQCLEAVWAWMGQNGLQFNPSKTEWLWVFGPSRHKILPSLVLDGMTLTETEPM